MRSEVFIKEILIFFKLTRNLKGFGKGCNFAIQNGFYTSIVIFLGVNLILSWRNLELPLKQILLVDL